MDVYYVYSELNARFICCCRDISEIKNVAQSLEDFTFRYIHVYRIYTDTADDENPTIYHAYLSLTPVSAMRRIEDGISRGVTHSIFKNIIEENVHDLSRVFSKQNID